MRAVRLQAYGEHPRLEVKQVTVPLPGPNQVLVRVDAAPIHPLDVRFCAGDDVVRKPLPCTPGFEGTGEVVAHGGGVMAPWLMGRRVAFVSGDHDDGSWAEYALVSASRCLPVWKGLSPEAAATLSVYPVAALALLQELRQHGHTAAVHTAAGGIFGVVLEQLAAAEGFPLVQVVRRPEVAETMRARGAAVVLVSSDVDFDARLRRACHELRATALIDAVAGPLTGRVLAALPDGAEAVMIGWLSGEPVQLDARDLVIRAQTIRGFHVWRHLEGWGLSDLLGKLPRLRRRVSTSVRLPIAGEISFEEVAAAVVDSVREGVVLLRPARPAPEA